MDALILLLHPNGIIIIRVHRQISGGSRSTVEACWTSGQQVERSILHLGIIDYPRMSRIKYSLTLQNCGLQHHSFHSTRCPSYVTLSQPCSIIIIKNILYQKSFYQLPIMYFPPCRWYVVDRALHAGSIQCPSPSVVSILPSQKAAKPVGTNSCWESVSGEITYR